MPNKIQVRRGLKANLPSVADLGEILLTTDTHELFAGTGTGIVQITSGNNSGLNFRGAWSSGASYVVNDLTTFSNTLYIALLDNSNAQPDTNPTDWEDVITGGGAGSSAFADLTSGTNTTATMTVGTGASLTHSGTGVINATEINGVPITGTPDLGKIPIGQGDGTAVFADPFVQGAYAPGTNVTTGGISGGPVNPVLVGGKGADGLLHDLSTDNSGVLNVTGPLTDTQLRASAVPVSLTSTTVTGSVAVTGTFFQTTQPVSGAISFTAPQHVIVDSATLGTVTVSGTVASTQSGTWNIGTLATITNPVAVTGTFWQTTQPVSGTVAVSNFPATQPVSGTVTANAGTGTFAISAASLPLPSGASTSAKQPALGTAGTASADVITVQGIASMTALKVDGSGVTQPVSGSVSVSGTVTANIGTTNGLALDATLTGGTAKTLLYDGTNTIGTAAHPVQVSLANTAANATAVKVDGSAVTQPVSGTFFQATQPVSIAETVNTQDASEQSIGAAVSTKATMVGVKDSSGNVAFLNLDASGNLKTTGSGGGSSDVQFADNAASGATPTGTLSMGWDSSNTKVRALLVDANQNLKIRVAASDLTDPAEATANAVLPTKTIWFGGSDGTNLQGVLVESASHPNLRTSIYNGATELALDGSGRPTVNVNGTAAVTQSGTWTVATNADQNVAAGTVAAKALLGGTVYNNTNPAPTNGQGIALQSDLAANLKIAPGLTTQNLSAWNAATALNSTQVLITQASVPAVLVQLVQTTPFSAGAATFELTYDDTNWITVPAALVLDPSTLAQISIPYTYQANTNKAFLILLQGARQVRIKNSTAITGSGTVTPFITNLAYAHEPQLNSTGALKVDATATTQPVSWSGQTVTVTQSTASSLKVDLSGTSANATAIKVDGSAVTQPVSGTVTANQGGTWTVQPGNTANTTPWLTTQTPATSGGWTTNIQTALTNGVQTVKASAGQLGGYSVTNPNASTTVFVIWYNNSSPTIGTTTPIWFIAVPGGGSAHIEYNNGIPHSTGIYVIASTSLTSSAAPASSVQVATAYK